MKQSVSAVFSQVHGRKRKPHAHHILALRAIIPASSSFVWLRDLSSSSCADSESGSGNSISFAEAKRLLRLVNVEALKTKLGIEGKEVIGYSELLEACETMGVARSPEEAAAFARVLDEAGVVLLFRDKVYLHPDKVRSLSIFLLYYAASRANQPNLTLLLLWG